MSAAEHVRHEWKQSARELEEHARDGRAYARLLEQVELVTAELRRRVGQTFTLADLEGAYRDADRWAAEAFAEAQEDDRAAWPTTLGIAVGAAFHAYARGATDYGP